MTNAELEQLDRLIAIAHEDDTPLRSSEREFIDSLDRRRSAPMTDRQADWFDDLVRRHLIDRG